MSFGYRVIGVQAAAAALAAAATGANKFGHRVVGKPVAPSASSTPSPVATATPPDTQPRVGALELAQLLAANPAAFDVFYQGEIGREEGPRRNVLQLLHDVESAGQQRPEVLSELALLLDANKIAATAAEVVAKVMAPPVEVKAAETSSPAPGATEEKPATPPKPATTRRRSSAAATDLAAVRALREAKESDAQAAKPAAPAAE